MNMVRACISLGLAALAAALLIGAAWAPSATALTFGPHFEYGCGGTPSFVAVADLNADGKADLATANQAQSTTGVLLGDGHGHFARTAADPVTNGPAVAIAVGYFDADTNIDMATANVNTSTVSVLVGDGAGGFLKAAVDPPVGGQPYGIAQGFLNADTAVDLVTANSNSTVSVLLGNNDGTFAAASTFASVAGARGVAIAEVDGDGKVDLVTCGGGVATVGVHLGNNDGTFGAPVTFPIAGVSTSLVVTDFNADGKADVATACPTVNVASVLLNTTTTPGTPTFAAKADFFAGPGPWSVTAGDFNGDGRADVAAANNSAVYRSVSILPGDGAGELGAPVVFASGYTPLWIAAGDFNGGQSDVVTASSMIGYNSVSVLLNTTKAKITSIKPAKAKPGATVTITGTGFGSIRGVAKVLFGTKAATKYPLWSQTQIKVKVPSMIGGKKTVTVKTVEGKSAGKTFTVL